MTDVHYGDWHARAQDTVDPLDPWRCKALHATLDLPGNAPGAGEPMPLLWHWIHFLDAPAQRDIGADGHPRRGGFIPPVELPGRMWAAGGLRFHRPLIIGQAARKHSVVSAIAEKSGRSGKLCFVTVEHQIFQDEQLAIEERQDIVFREAPSPGAKAPAATAPTGEDACHTHRADPALLMRYSSLTFNAHRIHYDAPYARDVEHYEGLVVHGPLQATMMAALAQSQWPSETVSGFEFRARSPLFADEEFQVCGVREGNTLDTFVRDHQGGLTMSGQFTLT